MGHFRTCGVPIATRERGQAPSLPWLRNPSINSLKLDYPSRTIHAEHEVKSNVSPLWMPLACRLDFRSRPSLTQLSPAYGPTHLAAVFAAATHVREALQAAIDSAMLGNDPYGRRPDRFCERSLRWELTGTAALSAFELITSAAMITMAIVQ